MPASINIIDKWCESVAARALPHFTKPTSNLDYPHSLALQLFKIKAADYFKSYTNDADLKAAMAVMPYSASDPICQLIKEAFELYGFSSGSNWSSSSNTARLEARNLAKEYVNYDFQPTLLPVETVSMTASELQTVLDRYWWDIDNDRPQNYFADIPVVEVSRLPEDFLEFFATSDTK